MIWLAVAAGVVAVVLLALIALARRPESTDSRTGADVDPLFTTGIAITGAGIALATTLGGFMYGVMIVGLIVMAVGANRTGQPHH